MTDKSLSQVLVIQGDEIKSRVQPKRKDTYLVCAHCIHIIRRIGPDALDYCDMCESIEGDVKEITEAEYEEAHS